MDYTPAPGSDRQSEELNMNLEMIMNTARAGGRCVHVYFGLTGRAAMAAKLNARGFTTEYTQGEFGLKVSW